MITTIIAWIYITFLSFSWGKLFFRITAKSLSINHISDIHFSIVCCNGIVVITTIGTILSFFLPLGLYYIQLILLLPCLFSLKEIFGKKNTYAEKQLSLLPLLKLLLACYIIVALLMSTWTISHPDTLTYHIQIIKWIEDYKAVPGIANLNARFGFQSMWFITCAIFDLKFTGAGSYIYLNSLVTVWFVYFLVSKINHAIITTAHKEVFLWIVLLILSLCSYTQILLTASSASPDFITCLYIWMTFYFLYDYQKKSAHASLILTIAFSFFSFCIKLSAAPIIIIALYAFTILILNKRYKAFLLSSILAVAILTCFTLRSVITSGYIFYPSIIPDIVNTDWKVQKKKAQREARYVTAFAKTESEQSDEAIASTNKMVITEWMPIWWRHRSITDKIILILSGLSILSLLFYFKHLQKQNTTIIILVLSSLCGTFFWFFMAPDPRFGFGFLVALIGFSANRALQKTRLSFYSRRAANLTILLLSTALIVYTIHRCTYYFSKKQLMFPLGIEEKTVTVISCDGNDFNMAQPYEGCGEKDLPCIENSCKNFSLRGVRISDGFKPK